MSHVKEIQLYRTSLRTGHREGEYSLFCFVLPLLGLPKKKKKKSARLTTRIHTHIYTQYIRKDDVMKWK